MMYLISPHSISLRGFMKIPVSVHGWPSACYYILPTTAQYLSATLTKSGPLDFVGIKLVFYFLPHEKSLGHMFQIQSSCSSILFFFFASPQAKNYFWQDHPCGQRSDRKCKFHRFCPGRRECNNTAHAILSCYKLQDVFSQFTDEIWKLRLIYPISDMYLIYLSPGMPRRRIEFRSFWSRYVKYNTGMYGVF